MPKSVNDIPKILSQNLFPVVGIGASAGGLDAFKKLIKVIPENSGMAYILVQHLHPEYDSALPEILQRLTKIPVVEISNNVHVEPDHIYVIPSNKMLVATDGILKLSPRLAKNKLNLPIDIFFSSLAEVHQAHAIGVVLSGTGADGSIGLKNIKDHGGLTFAQEPSSASYTGMPQHAINEAAVDFILMPEKMPEKLMELRTSFEISDTVHEHMPKDKMIEEGFKQILALLRLRVGVDFSFYKQTTVRRRIIRRMVMLQHETIMDYVEFLKKNKPEQDILFYDLLIPVTSFFRDQKTFDTLCETIFPVIAKNKSAINPLRIWIAGCSTGQEAYSMAMCCCEYFSDRISNIKVQIFATDLSDKSIKHARAGIYSKKEVEGMPEGRLEQFFTKTDGKYQVKKPVRDMCVFAVHNFLKDPPFAKIDFISCRNVLIYLEPFLQKKALTIFHYALNEKGILWLGKSETTGNSPELFIPFDKKDKFFTRKSVPGRFMNVASERVETAFTDKNYLLRTKEGKTNDFQKNADEVLLSTHTPPGVVVNDQLDILQFRGSTIDYLVPSSGKASFNVLKMAKEGLGFEIRNAIHKAKTSSLPFTRKGIAINNGKRLVTIEVIPLLNTIDLHFLILFSGDSPVTPTQLKANKEIGKAGKPKKDERDTRIQQLEKELTRVREEMRSITEDQEASNEELQSSNEELLSGSEELQSLNEELETSKEELQSTNEELITVNQELYDRNDELSQTRTFAEAIISTLHEPLLVLDKGFVIKSANDSFCKTFQLTEEDTLGKILFELQENSWDIPALRKELVNIQKAKEKLIELEITCEFPGMGKRTICFNIQPVDKENGEQLILLALDDISARRNMEQLLEEKANGNLKERQFLYSIFNESPALLCVLKGPDYVFEFANPAYLEFTGQKELVGKTLKETMPELENQGFFIILDEVYKTGISFIGKEMPVLLKTGNPKTLESFFNFSYKAFGNAPDKIEGILVFAYDVTEQVMARKQLELNAEMITNLYMNAPAFVCTFRGPKHIYELVNPSYQKLFGSRKIVGKPIMVALPELKGQGFDKILDNVYNTGEIFVASELLIWLAPDEGLEPAERYFNFSYQPIYNEVNKITGILVFGYEVTDEVLGKKMQLASAERFAILADAMPQKMWTANENGDVNYLNQQWLQYTHKSFEDLKGQGWEKIIHPDDWKHNKGTWLNSIKTGEDFQLEHRFLRFDGTYHWHLSRGLAQKDKDGKVIVWIGTHTDIDEQKIKEQQKDEFISIASHEMKTPLTTAKAYLQLLEMSLDKDNQNANLYTKKASHAVSRLNDLIGELLDVSKIQYGKLNYHISNFDFNDLIVTTVEDIQHASPQHTIVQTGKVHQSLTGDKDRLQQVIINLLSNAIKYSPTGGKVF
ncbi:MAG: chemotaxis protein CheB, partial [Ferruginibacter sp.]